MSESVKGVGASGAAPDLSSLHDAGERRPPAEGEAASFRKVLQGGIDPQAGGKDPDPAGSSLPKTGGKPAFPETGGKPAFPETGGQFMFPGIAGKPADQEAGGQPALPGTDGKTGMPETKVGTAEAGGKPAVPETGGKPVFPETAGKPGTAKTDEKPALPGTEGTFQSAEPGGKPEEKVRPETLPAFSGDALLRSMGGSYAPLEANAVSPAASDSSTLTAQLVDRILVAKADQAEGKGGEVRLTLKNSLLPDTEIILRREGEKLLIALNTGSVSSQQVLLGASQDLREKLLALEKEVSVEVGLREKGGDGGENSSRRSRGLDYFSDRDRA
jgi:type III secretion system needle length determinant